MKRKESADAAQHEWYRLDNAALVYSAIQRSDYSAVYRFSLVLDRDIDPAALRRAAEKTMPRFPGLCVRMRRGVFWYYLDGAPGFVPEVRPDVANPCQPVRFSPGEELVRIYYYRGRMSVELFHALADGTGALVFLKTLAAQYLRETGCDVPCTDGVLDIGEPPSPGEWEDAYPRYAVSRAKRSLGGSNAYRYTGTPEPFYTLNVTMGTMPVAKLKEDAKRCGATVTEYLAAALIRTLIVVQHSERRRHEKPVALVVPVNLRPFFPTKTMRNFILTVRPCIDPELGDYTFEEIVQQVHHYMRLHLTRQELAAYLTKNVALQRSPLLRFVPSPVKNLAMALGFRFVGERPYSMTLTNPGILTLPPELRAHVERAEMILGQSYSGRSNCAVLSLDGDLTVTFSGTIREPHVEREFFRFLVRRGVPVKVISNRKEDASCPIV